MASDKPIIHEDDPSRDKAAPYYPVDLSPSQKRDLQMRELHQDMYGNVERGIVGVLPRLKTVEEAAEDANDRITRYEQIWKGVSVGLAVQLVATVLVLLKIFNIIPADTPIP